MSDLVGNHIVGFPTRRLKYHTQKLVNYWIETETGEILLIYMMCELISYLLHSQFRI